MNADEIVKALRERADAANKRGYSGEASEWLELAELIEQLQAQLEQKTNEAEGMRSNWYKCIENLKESQRRADAAVEDINSVRMCHTCKHFLREFGMGGIECKMPCATIRHENFEWRGPSEVEPNPISVTKSRFKETRHDIPNKITGRTSIMDEYTACEQAYKNGYEQGKKEATEAFQKEIARLACESVKRELALAKLEAEIKAVIERLSRE